MATRPSKVRIPVTEDQVQETIISGLQYSGFRVLVTSRRRRGVECPNCHKRFRPTGGDGADKGIPDLLVTHDRWPHWLWLGMEVKGPKTAISPEQKALNDLGRIVIVRSVEDALLAARQVDNLLRSERVDPALRMTGGHH